MKRVLMVVDMLNGFLVEGHNLYCGPSGRAIIPFVRDKIKEYNQAREPVIFLCDSHDADDKEFKIFGRHCVTGTSEAEIIAELRPLAKGAIVLPKKKYFDLFTRVGRRVYEHLHLLRGRGPAQARLRRARLRAWGRLVRRTGPQVRPGPDEEGACRRGRFRRAQREPEG